MSRCQQDGRTGGLCSHSPIRNTDLAIIYKPKHLHEIFRIHLRSCSTLGEQKAENSCSETDKSNFILPMSIPPSRQHSSMTGENVLAHHFYLGGKEKSGACVPMFQLFRVLPKGLISVLLTDGTDRKPTYFGCLVPAACC